ncbi:MAG: ABC transporter permease, partial [Clostridia bacterium]|nr:ABC transporter permease [Clostridia bacterium]
AKFNPGTMAVISAMLVFLNKGAITIASKFNLSNDVSDIIQGIILFFILGSEFFINYRIQLAHEGKKEEK